MLYGVLGLVCVGLPAVLALIVVVAVRRDEKTLRDAARRFACSRCSAILGDAGLDLADALWRRHMDTLRERNPDVKFRIVRDLHGVCSSCGARFRFDRETRTFVQVDVALSFETPEGQ